MTELHIRTVPKITNTKRNIILKQLSSKCKTLKDYKKVMNEVPITNIGRFLVSLHFTLSFIRKHPWWTWGVIKFWTVRIFNPIKRP